MYTENLTRANINKHGVSFADNGEDAGAISGIQEYRKFRVECLDTTMSILEKAEIPNNVLMGARLKRLNSIRRKLKRDDYNFRLSNLDDIVGVRIICQSYQSALALSDRIAALPQHIRKRDYIKTGHPLGMGYRAIHHVLEFSKKVNDEQELTVRFEVQVRSFYQHQWAVRVEAHSEHAKEGFGATIAEKEKENKIKWKEESEKLAEWEEKNPTQVQEKLPQYHGVQNIAVVSVSSFLRPKMRVFRVVERAVGHLDYLENSFPRERHKFIMLVGMSLKDENKVREVLQETHPFFVNGRVPKPSFPWSPKENSSSCDSV